MGDFIETAMLPLQHSGYRFREFATHSFRKPGLDQFQICSCQDSYGSFRQQCKMLFLRDNIDNIFAGNGSIQLLLEQQPGNILAFRKSQKVLAGVNFGVKFLCKSICQC